LEFDILSSIGLHLKVHMKLYSLFLSIHLSPRKIIWLCYALTHLRTYYNRKLPYRRNWFLLKSCFLGTYSFFRRKINNFPIFYNEAEVCTGVSTGRGALENFFLLNLLMLRNEP
jgi:RsiW-degrading membrane proteinase PrsW (M82 family)